jgi:serine/threonine protein kinase
MVRTNPNYAIFFNEGPGYLFVDHLGEGCFGKAMLVRSCAFPYDLCVRKRVVGLIEDDASPDGFHGEVRNYRQFKHVPELIDWTSYDCLSYAITTQFCNGGTLEDFIVIAGSTRSAIPEIFIWRVFTQILETLEYLHCRSHPPVAHHDISLANVYLHWQWADLDCTNDDQHHLPEVFLGDFGLSISNADEEDIGSDLRQFHLLLIRCCLSTTCYNPEALGRPWPSSYSPELSQCLKMLPKHRTCDGWPQQCPPITPTGQLYHQIMPIVQRKLAELQTHGPKVDYRSMKPNVQTEISLAQSTADFTAACSRIDDPFRFAIVDPESKAVLQVLASEDAETPVAAGIGCPTP